MACTWGDLGQEVTGLSVAHLIDGHGATMAPGVPGTSLRARLLPALDIPGTISKAKGAPRKYQDEPSSWSRRRVPGGWGFLGPRFGREWGLSPYGSRQQIAVPCIIVAALREEWDSVLARWTARDRHPGAT